MQGIITIDVGTTSVRAILYDVGGSVLHGAQRDNRPDYLGDGRVEQDARSWTRIVPEVLRECAGKAVDLSCEVLGVAVTAQRSSLIALDRAGAPLLPAIMWQDRRSAALAEAMRAYDPLVFARNGLKISPVFSALKMLWLRRECPDLWPRARRLVGIQDWILHRLTGRFVTDHSFGSRTNLFDIARLDWDDELLRLFEVDRSQLCELVPPGSIVGGLLPAVASQVGLPPGLPVISAGGDQQCAALGLGLFTRERAVANTGTGSFLIGHAEHPALDPQMRVACNVSAIPGAYIVEAALLTSGTVYRWFGGLFAGAGEEPDFAALDDEAAQIQPGANGLMVLPHFEGAGAPHWDPLARGVAFGLGLSTTRGELARAILEGIAIELKGGLELIEDLCGAVAEVSVSGGMCKSDLFNRIQCDVFDRPLVRYADNEATARGAWIAAIVALGLEAGHAAAFTRSGATAGAGCYHPDPLNRAQYDRQCRKARALYAALAVPELRDAIR